MICAECIRLLLAVDYWREQNEQTRQDPVLMSELMAAMDEALLVDPSEALERLQAARTQLDNHQRGHAARFRTACG